MNLPHDVIHNAETFRLSLSVGQKPIGLLLGAGCPLAVKENINGREGPLIPGTDQLTDIIRIKISEKAELSEALDRVITNLHDDGTEKPNCEDIFNHIRSLITI